MSISTVAEQDYEIREGHSSFAGIERPHIDGVVDGQAVVTAFETPPVDTPDGPRTRWLMATYSDVAELTGVACPLAADIADAQSARQWVEIFTALYAKAAKAAEVSAELRWVAGE
jgi:hypothetical protein